MYRIRAAALLALMAVLVAACGARLSPEELKAASAGGATGVQAGSPSASSSGGGVDASGAATATGDAGAPATGAASGATATGGGSAAAASGGGASGGAAATPAPAGGNGGATDVGVTANEITVGTVATLTGPVPGLFRGAVVGTQAYFAYLNSKGGIYGRKFKVLVGDDKLSADENRAQVINFIPKVFSFVGSFSTFDEAGVGDMQTANVPDVGYSLSPKRMSMPQNFSPQPLPPGWRLGPLNWFKQTYGDDVVKNVGALVANVASPKAAWEGEKKAMESVGYRIVYEREVQPTETDFTADVVQMRRAGVQMVVMTHDTTAFVRVAKAMAAQNWKPKLMNWGSNAYDPDFISSGGAAVEGSVLDMQQALYGGEDAGTIPEVALFDQWLKRVAPDFKPDLFSLYGWASGMLFAQALQAAGPKATRAGLLDALRKIDNFDANGLLPPVGPASRRPANCWLAVEVKGGKFVRKTPDTGFRCNDGGYFRL